MGHIEGFFVVPLQGSSQSLSFEKHINIDSEALFKIMKVVALIT